MTILACGINHKTAPLALRERLSFSSDALNAPLESLVKDDGVREAVILSTCNRTELYCTSSSSDSGESSERAENAEHRILDWLMRTCDLEPYEISPYLYVHQHHAAVRHIMRVASGLDSMVIGEPQILGQLKRAVDLAEGAGTIGSELRHLFNHVFSVSKQVRTATRIAAYPVSVAFAGVSLAKKIFADLSNNSALLIGAGETIELVATYLRNEDIKRLFVANRTIERAQALAGSHGGHPLAIGQVPDYLHQVDLVITATASQLPIIGKGMVERVAEHRRHRPMFMLDLAVPRDIEPEVGDLEDIYLYCVDDLQAIVQDGIGQRKQSIQDAEHIIQIESAQFMQELRSLDAVDTIRGLRSRAESLRDLAIAQAVKQLNEGRDPEDVVKRLAYSLTNKLLHQPSVELRRLAAEERMDLLAFASQLLGVNDEV